MRTSQKLSITALFVLLFSSAHSFPQTFSGLESTTLEEVSSSAGQWGLKIVVFNVGQADAVLLLTPNGDVAAIDTGTGELGSEAITKYLADSARNGIGKLKTINLLYSTHYDNDHIGGLNKLVANDIAVLKAFDQGPSNSRLLRTDKGNPSDYAKYLEAVGDYNGDNKRDADEPNFIRHKIEYADTQQIGGASNNVKILCVSVRGDTEGYKYDINLDPASANYTNFDENPGSIALLVRLGEFEFYTAGDQTSSEWKNKPATEEAVLNSGAILGGNDIDVLKVNHHGSDTSTGKKLVKELLPEVAIISTKFTESAKLPKKIVLKELEDNRSYVLITGDGQSNNTFTESSETDCDDNYTPSTSAVFNNQGDITVLVSKNGDHYTVTGENVTGEEFSKTFSALDSDNTRSEADNVNATSDSVCE